ncbi:helix-turn-helix domain-containing protein [Xenophilus sp. Marseille-Q4582]|uniref:helix-turn-helix domain-containing protein n=1 Tax=Xenophilus sp. Marseille-Q4582 TaxID=2866600 RepID=UPI001CE3D3A8|nr:helix-turn-helix domain-containing protein [Xenophilus sp. Marseille-Q4582]
MTLPEILYTEDLAKLFKCQPSTVDQAARDGAIPSVKFGHDRIFPRDALIERLNEMARDGLTLKKPGAAPSQGTPIVVPTPRKKAAPTLPDLSNLVQLQQPT